MTLINLSTARNKNDLNTATLVLVAVATVCAITLVFAYSNVINKEFAIRDAEKRIETASLENADYKVQLHATISPEQLEWAKREFGLVKESSPQYHYEAREMVARSDRSQ